MTRTPFARWRHALAGAFTLTTLTAGSLLAQGATISGRVRSEQGQLLQGANVLVTELNVSVGTSDQGVYRITLPAERVRGQTVTIRVRSIGYAPM
ncbi:MAG: carboxypeptidase-like regulatory domain-containing protein, partial [Gemmatimonadaceae bacterium]